MSGGLRGSDLVGFTFGWEKCKTMTPVCFYSVLQWNMHTACSRTSPPIQNIADNHISDNSASENSLEGTEVYFWSPLEGTGEDNSGSMRV